MRAILVMLAVTLTALVATALGAAQPVQPLRVSGSAPRTVAFGDSFALVARVHIDGDLVDPSDVQVEAQVTPFSALGAPELRRSGNEVVLKERVACLEAGCVPGKRSPRQLTLPSVRATAVAKDGTKLSVRSAPLEIGVATRLTAQEIRARSPLYARQTGLPAPAFRLAPGLLIVLLLVCAVALLAPAALLVRPVLRP
ncbi:MAG: hypothetical protein H0X39_18170, partial [Actinobacteria bacterium]|nr:hypothetical protein [Actinomycetota bacterium]